MKKLISFLLMVAMGLGMVSCVSNTESDSVKAIRDAKAAQLLALAELHKAQAEAETLLAKAQAALLEAEARYQAALAEGAELENQKAKALLELEIETIKAELQAELNRLLAEIAEYKDDLRDELYSQMSYWLGKLSVETSNLVSLESQLSSINFWDVVDEEAYIASEIESNKSWIAYNDIMIAEYKKFIEANAIDWNAIYAQTAALETEIRILDEKVYNLGDQIDDEIDYLEDRVEYFNEDMFDLFQMMEDEFSGMGFTNFLDDDDDEDFDDDEVLVDYIQPFSAISEFPLIPVVRVNETNFAKLDIISSYSMPEIKDMLKDMEGEKDGKIDMTMDYDDHKLYPLANYWAERRSTYEAEFKGKVIAATEAVIEAQEAWSSAAAEDKEAAEAVLVAALDALDKYTMIGANIDDPKNGTFTMFVATTYDVDATPVEFIDPTDPTVSTSVPLTLSSGVREYYKYKPDFITELGLYIIENNAEFADIVARFEVIKKTIYQLDSDIVTIRDWVNEFVKETNADIQIIEAKLGDYKALVAELEAKEAEYEAKMTALVTSEQYENAEMAYYLQGLVDELVAENELLKAELEAYERGSSDKIIYESLLKSIAKTKANIERINAIIDQIEAEIDALISTDEGTQE
ncbi:MAG: hypothetical protein J6U80_01140 [Bacteroidales bacterium]|nr:hypothetical protein [Bacteroidales bacterium]